MNTSYLQNIKTPQDLKQLDVSQLETLCGEVRETLLKTVSENGGHLASNLGTVELSVALHKVFDSPRDQIVFDVGHQCYTHKLLTGRYESFGSLRKANGISGFCRPNESEHDIFYSGHSGTSVSAGLGLATAKKLQNDPHYVISVIGDGSFTGGMVYEALNNGGRSGTKHIVILNDNKMSISENVGAFAKYLATIRSTPQYYTFKQTTERTLRRIPSLGRPLVEKLYALKTDLKNRLYAQSTFFEDLGYRYMGPIDGHNLEVLIDALTASKAVNGPVLLHVITEKGKGYPFAENDPSAFHGVSKFELSTGARTGGITSFSDRFGEIILERAKRDERICAITAAMSLSTGLAAFQKAFPDRFFDVGIAEEHAVTFAAGLAKNGEIPVFAVYSAFLQRCFDQLVHDVSLQGVKIVLAVDHAGFVGEDGETHHGLMDASFLSSIPYFKIYSPCCFRAMLADLDQALFHEAESVAIRYPKDAPGENVSLLRYDCLEYAVCGDETAATALVTYGRLTGEAITAVQELQKEGTPVHLISLNQIWPLPQQALDLLLQKERVFFFEEGLKSGGIGEKCALALLERGFCGAFRLTAVSDEFVPQASVKEQLRAYRLNAAGMTQIISESVKV